MLTIYSSDHHLHRGVELKDGAITDSFENPLRAETVLAQVRAAGLGDVLVPRAFDPACYAGAHSARYVEFLAGAWDEWAASGRSCQALPLVWPVRAMPSAAALPD
ncbi:TPA: histone deacetylase family protein, partial [Burkholderia vietnamiensis]|nr:histone deacetylase family protein [Burkholderia vietnamiensis]